MSAFAWSAVAAWLKAARTTAPYRQTLLPGQLETLDFIADRIERHGGVVADEVGQGKTRIACAVVEAVVRCGGRAAVVAPRGLMHQWTGEYAKLQGRKPAHARKPLVLTTLQHWVGEPRHAATVASPWWLISHNFQYPRITLNSHDWKCALPSLVLSELHPILRKDGRTLHGRITARATGTAPPWPELRAMASRIARRIQRNGELHRKLMRLPCLGQDEETLRADFFAGGESWKISRQLLGLWMGPFDLVVIDEAHKSRAPSEDDPAHARQVRQKVLPELLGQLFVPGQRRLSLTATPMELEARQWAELVERTIPGRSTRELTARATAFLDGVRAVAAAPDDMERLGQLVEGARRFQEELEPVVTRRRLLSAQRLDVLRAEIGLWDPQARASPHPHRHRQSHPIPGDAGPHGRASRAMLVALEGYSRTSRGLPRDAPHEVHHGVKTLYTRIASGVELDDEVELDLLKEVPRRGLPPETAAQLDRLQFWLREYRRSRDALRREAARHGASGLAPGLVHPRLEATVDAVEAWTEGAGEKVLVFGTYKRPLRNLRDIIDVRFCLRGIDRGLPIPFDLAANRRLFPLAVWQLARMRAAGQLRAALGRRTAPKAATLAAMARKAYGRHERLRRSAATAVAEYLKARLQDDEHGLRDPLGVILRARVLDDLAAAGATEPPATRQLRKPIEDHMRLLRQAAQDPEDDREQRGFAPEALARIRTELEGEAKELRSIQTGYCRVMDGDTSWEVRRAVQEGFNRPHSFPRVVIAQSRVGREGLNLHGACRVLVQFHPEWNPGVVEQQIGRVDRLDSHWEHAFKCWQASRSDAPPRIEVVRVVYEGTYDAYQQDLLARRTAEFDATLFGHILSPEAWERVPAAWRERLAAAVPDFSPGRGRGAERERQAADRPPAQDSAA